VAVTQALTRVLLVDDHQLLTDSLARLLAAEPDIAVVGVGASVADARRLARERMDVVLMDYRLPDGTGADATRMIKGRWPSARVVMLTAVQDDETVLDSIQAGADGYLTKDRAVEDVVAAVRAARAGETLLPRSVIIGIAQRVALARDRAPERPAVEPLTRRELEVLRALADGRSSADIAESMSISRNTLRTHIGKIMTKLHAHSQLEAVTIALRLRIIEPPRGPDALY
jgi:DNA-binding NarL/FixJ family response regulator